MITIKNQTMTLSSPGSLSQMNEVKLSCFIGYNVETNTIPSLPKKSENRLDNIVIKSLERSIKNNAEVWVELSKH